jgi:hypothetical protein
MAEFNYSEARIEALLSRAEDIFRQRFLAAIAQIRNSVSVARLEELLSFGQFEEALIEAEVAATNIANAYVTAYVLAAEDVMGFISSSLGITIRFDQVNVRAVNEMRENTLRLIREFTSGQRATTRAALVEGIRAGLNPRAQAELFRQSIGLTVNQMRAVANFRRALESNSAIALQRVLRDRRFDPAIQRALNAGEPLSQAQIDRMVQRYYENSIAHRARVIARTESLGAVHLGSDAGFAQAIEAGLIDPDLSQTWHTAGDGRVRHPAHTFMNGQVRPFGQPFVSGIGGLLRYPGDSRASAADTVQCRCAKSTRFTSDIPDAVPA